MFLALQLLVSAAAVSLQDLPAATAAAVLCVAGLLAVCLSAASVAPVVVVLLAASQFALEGGLLVLGEAPCQWQAVLGIAEGWVPRAGL